MGPGYGFREVFWAWVQGMGSGHDGFRALKQGMGCGQLGQGVGSGHGFRAWVEGIALGHWFKAWFQA
jgi:hypothetical protein